MDNFEFALEYSADTTVSKENFFEEDGHLPFNSHSLDETKIMMEEVCRKLHIDDEYSLKKMEVVLRYELPFFTTNRRLVRNWLMENFIF